MDDYSGTDKETVIPPDATSRVTLEARKEGVFAGLTSGLASALIGQRLLRFNRNKTLTCGVLSGALAGYFFTQAFTSTALAQLRAEVARQEAGSTTTGNAANTEGFTVTKT